MSGTGWTWQHAQHHCDLPTYVALCEWWQEVPPAAIQLRRIAQYLGIKQDAQPGTARMAAPEISKPSGEQDVAMAAAMAGIPAFDGRPNDPMLDLIPPAPTP
ncbi:MAG: hypothetical protein Q8R67_02470 [Rhodoferax sp.]|nr:hypothetical protein [Rhodoferax sp.]MDP3650525.1 hypothetical protein [Rhodoferax sp.]